MGSGCVEEGCEGVSPRGSRSTFFPTTFLVEPILQAPLVKLQILTLAAKLLVLNPSDRTIGLLNRYIFSLARYNLD